MALTFIAPSTTNTDTIVARLTSDDNLVNVGANDFSLYRADTNVEIASSISVSKEGNYFWDVTAQRTEEYAGSAYLQISARAFRRVSDLRFVPSSILNSNQFEFVIPPPDAPADFVASRGLYKSTLRWTVISGLVYEYRIQGEEWEDAVFPQTVAGLNADTEYTFELRVKADGYTPAGKITDFSIHTIPFPIEVINEQFIPIGTKNYELAINLLGKNLDARVDGLQEGFYQSFRKLDDGNSQILVKSDEVTRLIEKALWTVNYRDIDDDILATSEIIYNVVPVAPLFVDPGPKTIYKGVPFRVLVEVLNFPDIQRGESELVGLKFEPVAVEDKNYIQSIGTLPANAELTFDTFDSKYYIQNLSGFDNLVVPFKIRDDAVTPVISGLTGGRFTGEFTRRFQVTAVPDPIVELSLDSPTWVSLRHVSGTTYEIIGSPPGVGTYKVTVLAIGFGTVEKEVTIEIYEYVPPVDPTPVTPTVPRPVISSISDVSRVLGYSSFTIQASLSAGSGVRWSISGIVGATISSSGLITIPAALSVGSYTATVQASSSGGSDTETFDFTVETSTVSPSGTITLARTAGDSQVDLSWNHPTVRGIPYTGYRVIRSTRSDFRTITVVANALLATSFSDTNVTNGTTYYYKVGLASYLLGIESNSVSATPTATPVVVAPVINAISNISKVEGYNQFTIQASLSSGSSGTWSISGIAGATISNRGLITIPAGLSVATYTATVTNRNSAGSDNERFSVAVSAATRAPSGTITLVGTAGNKQAELSWNHPSDRGVPRATYGIYRGTTFIANVSGTSYTDTELENGTSYSYHVVGGNPTGKVTSNTVSVTPALPVASAPKNLLLRSTGRLAYDIRNVDFTYRLEWDPPDDDGGSAIIRYEYRGVDYAPRGLTDPSFSDWQTHTDLNNLQTADDEYARVSRSSRSNAVRDNGAIYAQVRAVTANGAGEIASVSVGA